MQGRATDRSMLSCNRVEVMELKKETIARKCGVVGVAVYSRPILAFGVCLLLSKTDGLILILTCFCNDISDCLWRML